MNDPLMNFFLKDDIMLQIIMTMVFINITLVIFYKLYKEMKKGIKHILKSYFFVIFIAVLLTPIFNNNTIILIFAMTLPIICFLYTIYKWLTDIKFEKSSNNIYIASSFIFIIFSSELTYIGTALAKKIPEFYQEIALQLYLSSKTSLFIFLVIVNFSVFLSNAHIILKDFYGDMFSSIYNNCKKIYILCIKTRENHIEDKKIRYKILLTFITPLINISNWLKSTVLAIKNILSNILSKTLSNAVKISIILSLIIVYSIVLNYNNIFNKESTDFFSLVVITILVPLIYDSIKENGNNNKKTN